MSLPTPNTRKEQYLYAIATGNSDNLPTPITYEEEYLYAIAKGGGSGDGDMKKSVYDSDLDVAGAGGIKAFVNDAISGKVDKVEGKGLSTNDYTNEDKAIVDSVTDALAEKADTDDIPDLVSDNLAKGIFGNETVLSTDNVPFISKLMSEGKYQRKKFVGCSYVWNQLVDSNTESVTIASGHKYALYQNGAWSIGASDGTAIAVTGGSDLFTDLTQLFGSTAIADAIYNLEQATAGAGVAKLQELGFFTEDYYAYDAGSIQSVDIKEYSVVDGFNLWDEQWELGSIDANGVKQNSTNSIRAKNKIKVAPNASYYFNFNGISTGFYNGIYWYDKNNNFIYRDRNNSAFVTTAPSNADYALIAMSSQYGTTYNNDICINLSDPARNGQYEPYHKTTYPLTPTELRGVPKIDANNNIYCDGDEYASDGTKTEKYVLAVFDGSEDENWIKFTVGSASNFAMRMVLSNPIESVYNVPNIMISNSLQVVRADATWGNYDNFISILTTDTSSLITGIKTITTVEDWRTYLSTHPLVIVYKKATPTTETLTPFDYPQSVGSLEEIIDYKVEQEDRDVAIPTGHVTEYMGKGGEFTLPTLPETPSVLAFDGHNFFWKPETA